MYRCCSWSKLQWGHAFSDVETATGVAMDYPNDTLQWGHAFSDVETGRKQVGPDKNYGSFNGATPFQTWKRPEADFALREVTGLQWGHAFSDVETLKNLFVPSRTHIASMGPRLFRRGNIESHGQLPGRGIASMGPRLFRRGNVPERALGSKSARRFNGATPFQTWKRLICRRRCSATTRFNGATPFQTWKLSTGMRCRRSSGSFNGATPFQTWKP